MRCPVYGRPPAFCAAGRSETEPAPLTTVALPPQEQARHEDDRDDDGEKPRGRPQRPLRGWIDGRAAAREALLEAPGEVALGGREAVEVLADALEIRGARGRGSLRERAHLRVQLVHLVGQAPRGRARLLGGA